tara:strand:+ start:10181 stop:11398 length:1218 start_codon:yes stop_codon:yes gene_type:complete
MKDWTIDKFVLGVFFILFGAYAYAIAGNNLKYISLIIGFTLLVSSVNFLKNLIYKPTIFICSVLLFIFYILLSFLLNQETFNVLTITFDLICVALFVSGYYLARKSNNLINIANITKVIIFISIVIGNYYLIQLQLASKIGINTRDLGDDLNANGIAFITAQILILLIWLTYLEKSFFYKIILITSIILVSGNLLFTESRGAILFLILTLIISFGFKLKKIFNLKLMLYFTLIGLVLSQIVNSSEFILQKIELTSERFGSAIDYFGSNKVDNSLGEREKLRKVFWNNYDQMFFGQANYKPYPHNQILEIVMRWGIFGLPVLWLSLMSLKKSLSIILKRPDKKSFIFIISMLFLFTWLQSMTSLTLDNNRFLWLGFGFLLGYKKLSIKYPHIKYSNKSTLDHQRIT